MRSWLGPQCFCSAEKYLLGAGRVLQKKQWKIEVEDTETALHFIVCGLFLVILFLLLLVFFFFSRHRKMAQGKNISFELQMSAVKIQDLGTESLVFLCTPIKVHTSNMLRRMPSEAVRWKASDVMITRDYWKISWVEKMFSIFWQCVQETWIPKRPNLPFMPAFQGMCIVVCEIWAWIC